MKYFLTVAAAMAISFVLLFGNYTGTAHAGGFNGAIYDTDSTSLPVNQNLYNSKDDVYLNGVPRMIMLTAYRKGCTSSR